ncbi:SH3-like domain-containing protein [Saccharopolyspora flava]|uniref:Nitrile hydratase beta subunit n=1 Tax=Saccharopolyspora flava TaxID=95161 RepID=A0A1I6RKV3_9PSEU|nr:Nitrile hydratase beta subunit [Saccharopolyspora flava]
MSEPRFAPGSRVRAALTDPPHHTRVPRYVRGRVGEVVECQGAYPLPDDRARRFPDSRVEPVYTVRFAARDLWGEGAHHVTVDLWESYLTEET